MPGLNQHGPWNLGPRTGNRQGICATTRSAERADSTGFSNLAMNSGRRCTIRRRAGWEASGRQFPASASPGSAQHTKRMLLERTRQLEAELKAVKQKLSALDSK